MRRFVRRDSSVVAAAAAGIDLDYIRYVEWWEDARFQDEAARHAAELVAFDVLDPVLRRRGNPTSAAKILYDDSAFRAEMETVFRVLPQAGCTTLVYRTLHDMCTSSKLVYRRSKLL